jgi:hypothetical protein
MQPKLYLEKSLADLLPHLVRKSLQVTAAGADEHGRLRGAQQIVHPVIIISL